MKRLELLAVAGVLFAPSFALAANGGSVVGVALGGGLVGGWVGTTQGIAKSFLPFLLIVSMMVEAFGKAPGEPRDFGAVVWRFLVVFVLLTFYGNIFGAFSSMISGLADGIAPQDTWEKLQQATQAFLNDKATYAANQMKAEANSGRTSGVVAEFITGQVDAMGGALLDAVVTLIVLAGQASFRIVGTFGEVLKLLLYVLGPLAIGASVPRGSSAGTQWLKVFISVLMWPLISALLVGLLSGYALEALKPQNSYEAAYKSIVLAGILAVTSFAVPVIASALTGAGLGAVGSGWSSMNAWAGAAASGASAIAGGGHKPMQMPNGPPGPIPPAAPRANPGGNGGGGGALQSSARSDGGSAAANAPSASLAGAAAPAWARQSAGSIAPAQASVSPLADAAASRDVAQRGGAEFPPAAPQAPQPPPFLWSQGAVAPGGGGALADAPTAPPVPLAGPAALPSAAPSSAPPRIEPVAGPRQGVGFASDEAVKNWRKENPGAAVINPKARAEIAAEEVKLQKRQRGALQQGGIGDGRERSTVPLVPPFPKKGS